MSKTRITYWVAVSGYFGLIFLLLAWQGWISPPRALPISVALFLLLVPLLFPLRGILYGKAYTFAWASFLSMLYFIHGVVEAYSSPEDRWLAVLEIVLSVTFYTGSMLYARFRGRELKAQQPTSE
ncbi:MAG: DUF2069 domain-containing protein [Candidatus Thiodiazotropha sp.]